MEPLITYSNAITKNHIKTLIMNKTSTLLLALFAMIGWQLNAQNLVNVNVTVDASQETVDPTGVHVAGNWDPNNEWNPAAFPMNDNGDGTWSLTLQVAENSTFEYKFLLGNDWGLGNEGLPDGAICTVGDGNTNRTMTVGTEEITMPTVCYNSCASCKGADEYTVSFAVDLSQQPTVSDSVFLAGDFNGWSNDNMLISYKGDSVFAVALNLAAGDYGYKFKNGPDGWEGTIPAECNVNGNRSVSVVDQDIDQGTVCFESCEACGGPVETTTVVFLVDMTNEGIISGISDSGVHVAGSFQGEAGFGGDWNPGASTMTDSDGDNVYELVVTLPQGSYEYKYLNGNNWGTEESIPSACVSNGNRALEVTTGANDTTFVGPICYATCEGSCPPVLDPVAVTFRVDMINEFVSGDGLYLTGTVLIPAWRRDSLLMTENGSISGIYEYTVMLRPGEYFYKFVNGGTEATEENADFIAGGCGVDNGFGGSNRVLNIPDELAGLDTILPAYIYNSCDISGRVSTNNLTTAENLSFFPNPLSDVSYLRFDQNGNSKHTVRVFDLTGKQVWEQRNIQGNQVQLNASDFQKGMFIGVMTNDRQEKATFRFIVQ
jgi:hypothetical protein